MKTFVAMATTGIHRLTMGNACHHNNSHSFDRLFLKLADKMNMDTISNKFENWPDRIIDLRVTSS